MSEAAANKECVHCKNTELVSRGKGGLVRKESAYQHASFAV